MRKLKRISPLAEIPPLKNKRESLFSIESAKAQKAFKYKYLNAIMYLAPSDACGIGNTCPYASKGCREACLYTSGMGRFSSTQISRIRKTREFFSNPKKFADDIVFDIMRLSIDALQGGENLAVRLNGTSDIDWQSVKGSNGASIYETFPSVQFYEYTKNVKIITSKGYLPDNVHVTFSRSENNDEQCKEVLACGGNVAVVFEGKDFPSKFMGKEVVNGDVHDLRFLDGENVVVGLSAKADARHDTTGFVVKC